MKADAFVKNIEVYCGNENIRFTDARREVAKIIAQSDKAIGAYDILDQLKDVLDNPKPPTVYRAVEFLVEHHFIHKIESLNAFVSCCTDHRHAGSQFLVCDKCGRVEEAHLCSMPESLSKAVSKAQFSADSWNVEVHGLCGSCA